jgi:hypothetical protein
MEDHDTQGTSRCLRSDCPVEPSGSAMIIRKVGPAVAVGYAVIESKKVSSGEKAVNMAPLRS